MSINNYFVEVNGKVNPCSKSDFIRLAKNKEEVENIILEYGKHNIIEVQERLNNKFVAYVGMSQFNLI